LRVGQSTQFISQKNQTDSNPGWKSLLLQGGKKFAVNLTGSDSTVTGNDNAFQKEASCKRGTRPSAILRNLGLKTFLYEALLLAPRGLKISVGKKLEKSRPEGGLDG